MSKPVSATESRDNEILSLVKHAAEAARLMNREPAVDCHKLALLGASDELIEQFRNKDNYPVA